MIFTEVCLAGVRGAIPRASACTRELLVSVTVDMGVAWLALIVVAAVTAAYRSRSFGLLALSATDERSPFAHANLGNPGNSTGQMVTDMVWVTDSAVTRLDR